MANTTADQMRKIANLMEATLNEDEFHGDRPENIKHEQQLRKQERHAHLTELVADQDDDARLTDKGIIIIYSTRGWTKEERMNVSDANKQIMKSEMHERVNQLIEELRLRGFEFEIDYYNWSYAQLDPA